MLIKAQIFTDSGGYYANVHDRPPENFRLPKLGQGGMFLMGTHTYWAIPPQLRKGFGEEAMVLSRYSHGQNLYGSVLQMTDLMPAIDLAKNKGTKTLHVIGGIRLITSMLFESLIDELQIHLSVPLGNHEELNPGDKRCVWLADLKVTDRWDYLRYVGMTNIESIGPGETITINTLCYRRGE